MARVNIAPTSELASASPKTKRAATAPNSELAATALSGVFGDEGRLVIVGKDLPELGTLLLREGCELLWTAGFGNPCEIPRAALGAAREAAFTRLNGLGDALRFPESMAALRAAVAHVPLSGDDLTDSMTLVATIAVATAAWSRTRRGLEPIAPDPKAEHSHDLLRMIHGKAPTSAEAAALNRYLVTVADHGLNASTFAARVVASTGSDIVSAITAAVGALKGPLHGGAPGPVLDMLDAIATPENAANWLGAHLDSGERIMGMGHRIYRVRDPRAAALEQALDALELEAPQRETRIRLALARRVEHEALALLKARHPKRPLQANVEFYTAILLEALEIPRESFSSIFASGRVVGWCAHFHEQQRTGRLIRPGSRYVGALPRAPGTQPSRPDAT